MITYCSAFDQTKTRVYEIFPKIFNDNRGSFTEVLKFAPPDQKLLKQGGVEGIKQINRSKSIAGTVRGMHAQKGKFCQAKLVEALTDPIFDIITDARPDSSSFGVSQIFRLDPIEQNKLYVPRGFLHGFVVPKCKSQAIFQYFCDNIYDHSSEFGINPQTILPRLVLNLKELLEQHDDFKTMNQFYDLFELFDDPKLVFSEKDLNGFDYEKWMSETAAEYQSTGKCWYKDES